MAGPSSSSPHTIDEADGDGQALDPRAVAEYIRDLSSQLGHMARRADLPMLHYLLSMVRMEAEGVLGGGKPRHAPRTRRP